MIAKEIAKISHCMTQETMDAFVRHEAEQGASKNMLMRYRGAMKVIYDSLPEDKCITRERLLSWRKSMEDNNYASITILNYVKWINRYLDFVGCSAIRFNKGKAKDITGMSFGYLTAIEPTGDKNRGDIVWLFECKCGNMLEKKQILPVGSRVTVRYAADGGKETLLLIVGHLSLQNATLCYYDYICIYEEFGIARGVVYINHTDIVRVVFRANPADEAYERWLARKYPEYVAYYENGNPENRPDIDTMRAMTLNARDREYRKNRIKKIARYTCMGFCTLGVGLTILLTNRWEMAVGALLFVSLGMGMKK